MKIDENDSIPAYNKITAPAGLEVTAQRVFNTIVAAQDADFFMESDIPLLCVYARLLITWRAIDDRLNCDIQTTGVMLISNSGVPIMHPGIASLCKVSTAISGICAKLKLSPSARIATRSKHGNVTLTRPADSTDELFAGNEDLFLQ